MRSNARTQRRRRRRWSYLCGGIDRSQYGVAANHVRNATVWGGRDGGVRTVAGSAQLELYTSDIYGFPRSPPIISVRHTVIHNPCVFYARETPPVSMSNAHARTPTVHVFTVSVNHYFDLAKHTREHERTSPVRIYLDYARRRRRAMRRTKQFYAPKHGIHNVRGVRQCRPRRWLAGPRGTLFVSPALARTL